MARDFDWDNIRTSKPESKSALIRSRKAERERVEAQVALARQKYGDYFHYVHPRLEVAEFQRKALFPFVDKLLSHEIRRGMIFMPPRHGKSKGVTATAPAKYAGDNPDHGVIVLSYSGILARRFGRWCRDVMRSPEHLELYPACELSDEHRSMTEFTTLQNNEFYFTSFDGTITGLGAHLFIVDDPIKNMTEALSVQVQESQRETYLGVVDTRLEPDATILFNTTRWTPGDLAGWRMQEDGAIDYLTNEPYIENDKPIALEGKDNPWYVLRLPFFATRVEEWGRQTGEMLWPEKFKTPERAERECARVRAMDPVVVESEFQQEPKVGGGFWFKRDHINFYKWKSLMKKLHEMNKYIIVDPALAKHRKADYTVELVFATGSDENYYWLEMTRARFDPTERQDELFRLHRKYRPLEVGYEEYGLLADTHHIKNEMERQNYRFTIRTLGNKSKMHNVDKNTRIKSSLVPMTKTGKLWLPDPDDHDTPMQVAEMVRTFLRDEFERAPNFAHDDMLDALSRMTDPDLFVTFPQIAEDDAWDDGGTSGAGTSWMSS